MRAPARKQYPQRVSKSESLPAPIGGWNARDVLSDMDPLDAVALDNWFPATTSVICRKGYTQWATGITGHVETLLVYAGGVINKMFAMAGTSTFDVSTTAGGAVGAAVAFGTQTNAQWYYTNVATTGGNYLYAVNGIDKPRLYDGATWTAIDGASTPAITGVTTTNLAYVNLWKNRVWFIEDGTLRAWYLPTQAVGGAAQMVDLSAIASLGGELWAMGNWTIDAGTGVDDLAVWITTKGEVIVYRGTDPASIATWALVGIWQIGAPITGSRKCFLKFAGDLLVICQDGIMPLSGALQSSRVQPQVALSYKIQWAVSEAISNYSTNFGWQMFYYPPENQLWLNVPITGTTASQVPTTYQFVMNTITKNWCSFSDMNFNTIEMFNDAPYGGGFGYVAALWDENTDNPTTLISSGITCNAIQAFSYFKNRGLQKRFTMIRPITYSNGNPFIAGSINVDFDLTDNTTALATNPPSGSSWDVGLWDVALWGGGALTMSRQWQSVAGVGIAAAVRMKSQPKGVTLQWVSTDVVYEVGDIL